MTMSKDTPAEEVNKAEPEVIKLKNLLVKYEQWEAMIVAEDKMWWPQRAKDVMTNEIYEMMLELQGERNELLKRFTPESYINSSPPDAGKEQEAVWFAEWISLHSYIPSGDSDLNWILYLGELTDSSEKYTSQQLYTLYKQNK